MYAFERDIIEFVGELYGREGAGVIKYLMKNPDATDEEISGALGLRENIVRKVLYDFHARGAVELKKIRRGEGRDYEFRWSVKYDGFYRVILAHYDDLIERAREGVRFLREMDFYSCGRPGHPVMTMEEAFEYNFTCPLCGEVLMEVDNSGKIGELEASIGEYEEKKRVGERHYRLFRRGRSGKK